MNIPRITPLSTDAKIANIIGGVIVACIVITIALMVSCFLTGKI